MEGGLTDAQLRVWRFLRQFREREGYHATIRDIQEHMGWASVSTPHTVLTALERKGFVERKRVTRGKFVYVAVG